MQSNISPCFSLIPKTRFSQKSRSPSCGKDCSTASFQSTRLLLPSYLLPGFWMSDKPRVQQELAQELAELLLTITNISSSLNFLKGFWTTAVREWNGIDRLRCVLARFLSSFLIPLPEWTSTTLSSAVFLMPRSGSSYEPSGTPPLFKSIILYFQIQVAHSGKSSFLAPLLILIVTPVPPIYACQSV